jgi:hypothetical protein
MPIRINLLNEALAAEELRRRDPVKRAIFLGIFLVAMMLAWLSSTWLEYKLAQQTKVRLEEEISSRTNDFIGILNQMKRIADAQHKLTSLQSLSTNRFYQADLMNALQQIYVPGVQLVRLKLDQSYTIKEGVPDKTNSFGVVHGHPPGSTEHIVLKIDARDASFNPGDQVNNYKDAFSRQNYFKANLDPTNAVKLISLSSPETGPNGKLFVLFSLESHYADKTR